MSSPINEEHLLAFARQIQTVETIPELLIAICDEVRRGTEYKTAWLSIADDDRRHFRIFDATSAEADRQARIRHLAPIPVEGDAFAQLVLDSDVPVIIEDARTDPRVNKAIARAMGNVTIVNVPMRLLAEQIGAISTGTFDDEGVRLPTEQELDYLEAIAYHSVVASARIKLMEQRQLAAEEKVQLERNMLQRQRLESLGVLAGGVAHDFNNLLTIILASSEILLEKESDPVKHKDLEVIIGATEKAAILTHRLLALGQKQTLRLISVDTGSLLANLEPLIRRAVPERIKVVIDQHPAPLSIHAEPSQIEQVIMNVCLNAADAMPGQGRLSIKTEPVYLDEKFIGAHPWAKAGHYALITIVDDGTGIEPEVKARLFEPFFTTKGPDKGSGLGLAVSYGIIQQHDGLIHVYSELGIGTTFKIYLPETNQGVELTTEDKQPNGLRGVERILVADDQADVLALEVRILESAGYSVVGVKNGQEAVDAFERQTFDLLLFDAVMPVKSGKQAHEEICALYGPVPTLFATGYGASEVTSHYLVGHDLKVISKPFAPNLLLELVREVLDA